MAHAALHFLDLDALVQPDQRRRVRQAVGRDAGPLDTGFLKIAVDAAAHRSSV